MTLSGFRSPSCSGCCSPAGVFWCLWLAIQRPDRRRIELKPAMRIEFTRLRQRHRGAAEAREKVEAREADPDAGTCRRSASRAASTRPAAVSMLTPDGRHARRDVGDDDLGRLGPRRHPARPHQSRLSARARSSAASRAGCWWSSRSRRPARSRTRRSIDADPKGYVRRCRAQGDRALEVQPEGRERRRGRAASASASCSASSWRMSVRAECARVLAGDRAVLCPRLPQPVARAGREEPRRRRQARGADRPDDRQEAERGDRALNAGRSTTRRRRCSPSESGEAEPVRARAASSRSTLRSRNVAGRVRRRAQAHPAGDPSGGLNEQELAGAVTRSRRSSSRRSAGRKARTR